MTLGHDAMFMKQRLSDSPYSKAHVRLQKRIAREGRIDWLKGLVWGACITLSAAFWAYIAWEYLS